MVKLGEDLKVLMKTSGEGGQQHLRHTGPQYRGPIGERAQHPPVLYSMFTHDSLQVNKMKELIVDYRRQQSEHTPIHIDGAVVQRVKSKSSSACTILTT